MLASSLVVFLSLVPAILEVLRQRRAATAALARPMPEQE